ncbi:DUF4339 domain-containing protein [bacterium]|nr:DUF4339 domain-containing protein [bacterium]
MAEIQKFIAAGKISRQTPVWRTGMPNWIPAYDSELAEEFESTAEPPPLPQSPSTVAATNLLVYLAVFVGTVTINSAISPAVTSTATELYGTAGEAFGYAASLAIAILVSFSVVGLWQQFWRYVQSVSQYVESKRGFAKYKRAIWIVIGIFSVSGLLIVYFAVSQTQQ